MYKNLFGSLGHSWIEEATLHALKELPQCYIAEVSFMYSSDYIEIHQITGHEKNIYCINIYLNSKETDKAPYRFYVDSKVTSYIVKDFWRDCENRNRMPEMAPHRKISPSKQDLDSMRKQLKEKMLQVFQADFESCADSAGGDFLCHRNQYATLGCRKMLEFIRQANPYGIDIFISFNIENADGYQIMKTLDDLEIIDATVTNEIIYEEPK